VQLLRAPDDKYRGRRVLNDDALAGHRHNAEPPQVVLPDMPDSEITGKAIWALDEDRSNTATGNSSQISAISLRHGGLVWNSS
jgi:hypothetical protein